MQLRHLVYVCVSRASAASQSTTTPSDMAGATRMPSVRIAKQSNVSYVDSASGIDDDEGKRAHVVTVLVKLE